MNEMIEGDVFAGLAGLGDDSVHCVVTSPPYYRLRDYGVPGQIGLEATAQEYVEKMVDVFDKVRRVLRRDGTLWLNMGDSFVAGASGSLAGSTLEGSQDAMIESRKSQESFRRDRREREDTSHKIAFGLGRKNIMGMPWRVAMALQESGWILRQWITWEKPNVTPESVKGRPVTSAEFVFLFSKTTETQWWTHRDNRSTRTKPAPDWVWLDRANDDAETATEPKNWKDEKLADGTKKRWRRRNLWAGHDTFYDDEGIAEPATYEASPKKLANGAVRGFNRKREEDPREPWRKQDLIGKSTYTGFNGRYRANPAGTRKCRNVWRIATEPLAEAHFATFPTALVEKCLSAGTSLYGVCGLCGAQYRRITETDDPNERLGSGFHHHEDRLTRGQHGVPRAEGRPTMATTGWAPSCECESDRISRPIVLDPFAGAGSTAVGAMRRNCDSVGIELNPEYVEIWRRRTDAERHKMATGMKRGAPLVEDDTQWTLWPELGPEVSVGLDLAGGSRKGGDD